jgi:hypothetical protein
MQRAPEPPHHDQIARARDVKQLEVSSRFVIFCTVGWTNPELRLLLPRRARFSA